jgi:ubiquinone/menaquinone biosynthesis C-methylase UbiE
MNATRERPNLTKVVDPSGAAVLAEQFAAESDFMPDDPAAVLDIGCGGGDLACLLAPRAELMIGLDLSLEVLQAAALKKAGRGLGRLQLVVADVNRLPFRDASIDYVVSRYTLHHTDLEQSLPEVRRVIAPGGRLFLRDIFTRLPGLERFVAWQVCLIVAKAALHARGRGLKAGWRHLRFNLSRKSLDHVLHANRLVPAPRYLSVHRRWFPGCEFVRTRRAVVFWEAPVLKWRKPEQPG